MELKPEKKRSVNLYEAVFGLNRKESNASKTAATVLLAALSAIILSAGRVAAQSQPGRLLSTTQNQTIIACNTDSSNCFTIVGVGGMPDSPALASSPSVANNGTIAFNAIFSADGTCSPAGQGICPPLIFLMNADGTNVRQVTSNPNPSSNFVGDRNAIISPDGTRIAFVAQRNAATDGTYPAEVYVLNSDGTGMQQVTPFFYQPSGGQVGQFYSVVWSPDSSKLAVMGNAYGTYCGTFFGSPIQFDTVAEVNPDGSNFTYLTCIRQGTGAGNALDWSRDGTLIAYNGFDSNNAVNVAFFDLTGMGRFAPLSSSQLGYVCTGAHCLHFSPDSTQLAYANASVNISIINLNGTGRSDTTVPFRSDVFWEPGPAIPAAAQLTLAPNPVIEVWPGFSKQLTPTLSDAAANLILHTAASFSASHDYGTDGNCLKIGPYGLAFGGNSPGNGTGSISTTNAGLGSNMISYKCWTTQPCTYSLTPMSENFPSGGGSGAAGVMSDPGTSGSTCPYSGSSNASWIAITSGASGSGSGSVGFSVAGNTGSTSRQASLTIAGLTFTVTQDGPITVTLQSISVTPNSASVPAGLTQQFTATGHYSDSSTQDLTKSATWSSSNTSIATVSNSSGSQGLATGVAVGGPLTITAALNGISGTAQLTVTAPVLQSITVAPSSASVAAGLTQPFTATGHYSDSSIQTLTTSVTWSSSNTSIATISNASGSQGLATGVAAGGPVTITAGLNGINGTAQLTVTAPVLVSLSVTPANSSVPTGSTQQFAATGTYSDGSTQNLTGNVIWSSSNTAVATISASGLATAVSQGNSMISAKQGNISNSATMTVVTLQSITVSPSNPAIFVGGTQQFKATGTYSDGSTRDVTSTATWTSQKTSVATITSPGGLATGVAKGSTTITATSGGISGSTTLAVNGVVLQSITVTPSTATISVGGTQQFKATGNYNNGTTQDLTTTVNWSTSPKQLASISSTGLATGLKSGIDNITAKMGSISGTAALNIQ